MDYLHYRLKKWRPGEYINLPYGQKKMAYVYMKLELEDRKKALEGD